MFSLQFSVISLQLKLLTATVTAYRAVVPPRLELGTSTLSV